MLKELMQVYPIYLDWLVQQKVVLKISEDAVLANKVSDLFQGHSSSEKEREVEKAIEFYNSSDSTCYLYGKSISSFVANMRRAVKTDPSLARSITNTAKSLNLVAILGRGRGKALLIKNLELPSLVFSEDTYASAIESRDQQIQELKKEVSLLKKSTWS